MTTRVPHLQLLPLFSVANRPTNTFRLYFATSSLCPCCMIYNRSSPVLECKPVELDFHNLKTTCTQGRGKVQLHRLCFFLARKNRNPLVLCTCPDTPRCWKRVDNNRYPRTTLRWHIHPTNLLATVHRSPREKKMARFPQSLSTLRVPC